MAAPRRAAPGWVSRQAATVEYFETMAYRTGRCTNDLYCSFASAKQNLQVPLESQFVCPQCGKPLSVPPPPKRAFSPEAGAIIGVLVVIGAGSFAAGAWFNRPAAAPAAAGASSPGILGERSAAAATPPVRLAPAPAPAPAIQAAKVPSVAPPASATAAAAPAPRPPVIAAPAAPLAAPPAAPPGRTAARAVTIWAAATQPAAPPGRQPPGPAPKPAAGAPIQLAMLQTPGPAAPQAPARLAAEAARQAARAAELDKRAAAQAAAQKQKAAQLALLDQKRRALAAKAQADAQARAAQEAAAARQAQRDAEAASLAARQAAATPPPPRPAPVQTGETRGFSSTPVEGGAPAYPDAYESDGRTGRVTVSCTISAAGSPGGCRIVSSQGGVGFNNAVLSWLRSGRVRFAPILRDGKPQTETHSWSVTFQP